MRYIETRSDIRRDTSLINRKLPDEILTMIFLLLGPSSFKNPSVYYPLSWVCRRWRSILINTAKFWDVVIHKCWQCRKSYDFMRDVIYRSKSRGVDVILNSPLRCDILCFNSSRIRTLILDSDPNFYSLGAKISSQLDNLILSGSQKAMPRGRQASFDAFLRIVNPRFIELPYPLLYKGMPQRLNRLEWLKLNIRDYGLNLTGLQVFFGILGAFPSLRILNIINQTNFLPSFPAITLPNLRIISGADELRFIRTPALSYLGISSLIPGFYRWEHLSKMDISMVKRFYVAPCYNNYALSHRPSVVCISGGHSEENCEFFHHFHGSASNPEKSMDYHWTLPPPNSFHISFDISWSSDRQGMLYSQLKQGATSLVELIVDCQLVRSSKVEKYNELLGNMLNHFGTVTHLSVSRSRSFVAICNLLMDGKTLPCLERFTYHSSYKPNCRPTIIHLRMKMVQGARVKAGSVPLKILELKSFIFIPQEQVEKVKELGIQLIQT